MSLPTMTPEQREQALAAAKIARSQRAAALEEVRKGALPVADVLTSPGPLQRAKVRQVLLAVPGIGPVKADSLMTAARIDPKRRVGGLGSVQRTRLAELLAA